MIGSALRWFRRRRLRAQPFPLHWPEIFGANLPFYARLSDTLRARFHEQVRFFLAEKHFIGAADLEVTETMRLIIAGVAVRLTLHLDLTYYDRLTEIVVYPYIYRHKDDSLPDGQPPTTAILGEARDWGTVVLSWPAVQQGLINPCDGHDTATHEFAHVLDRQGGRFNGTPRLRATEDYHPWAEVLSHHFAALQARELPERAVLRNYGATNEAEFFAVATETFFEKPTQMKTHTPELYAELQKFFGFDPAADPLCGRPAKPSTRSNPEE